MSLNKVTLSGHLGKAAELRATRNGGTVLSFNLAVNERMRQADGSYADYTNWFDCIVFGKRGEALQPYLGKGLKVAVTGRLRYSAWEKDGQRRSRVEVIADEIELMTARRDRQQPTSEPEPPAPVPDVYDQDIPF